MLDYWYVWPIGIVLWILVGLIAFSYFEKEALMKGARPDQITLSMFMYTIFTKFPLAIMALGFLMGTFFGGLSVHFLWHWCPPGSTNVGEIDANRMLSFLSNAQ